MNSILTIETKYCEKVMFIVVFHLICFVKMVVCIEVDKYCHTGTFSGCDNV
jgi:hypothetical protein